jgi:hypothetical protein
VFGRRSSSSATDADQVIDPDATATSGKTAGKGRPTPKRRDAEAARKANRTPPKDKKQARERMRTEQRRERAEQLAALKSGDERLYPMRDRGPARTVARNVVDGRHGAGEFFWPVVIGCLVLLLIPFPPTRGVATWLLLAYYLVIVVDTALLLVRLSRLLKRVAPDDPSRKGTLPYAFGRSLQSRKRRLPAIQVPIGWTRKVMRGQLDPLAD